MGRPKELSEEQRSELLAKGFVPVEIWIPDWEKPVFKERLSREMEEIAKTDAEDPDLNEWTSQIRANLWDDIEP